MVRAITAAKSTASQLWWFFVSKLCYLTLAMSFVWVHIALAL